MTLEGPRGTSRHNQQLHPHIQTFLVHAYSRVPGDCLVQGTIGGLCFASERLALSKHCLDDFDWPMVYNALLDITSNLPLSLSHHPRHPPHHRNPLLAIGKPIINIRQRAASATIASALRCGIALEPVRRAVFEPQMADLVEAAFLARRN